MEWYCEYAHAATARDSALQRLALFSVGCRRWECAVCGPMKRSILIKKITQAAPDKFITLTCRHEESPEIALEKISKALPKLIKQIRKKQEIEYLRMTEDCNDGYPHFHILARTAYINQAWLSEQWDKLTRARVVDIRKAHGTSVAYVAKYVTKARDITGSWDRQRIAVSRKFWVNWARELQWLSWQSEKVPFTETLDGLIPLYDFERIRDGAWWLEDREPGRELPEDFQRFFTEHRA